MSTNLLLACIWLLFIIRGLFYISFVPLWEGFDEWAHYAVIQAMATKGSLPSRGDRVSKEVQVSVELVPWLHGAVTHDAFWRMPEAVREERENALRTLPSAWASEEAAEGFRSYEAQQAPLYYWLFGLLYKFIASVPFLARVWVLRLMGTLVASAVVPLGFLVAKRVFASEIGALGIAAVITSVPELMLTVTHIGNDSLAVCMGSALLLFQFRWKDEPTYGRSFVLGSVFGLALLTKAYFIAVVPPVGIFSLLWARRKRAYRSAFLFLAWAAFIAGWWYAKTWMHTHSLSGEQIDVAAGTPSRMPFGEAVISMNWLRAIDLEVVTHVWVGNWSFLVVRSWMYRAFAGLAVLAGIGLIRRFLDRSETVPDKWDLALASSSFLTFVLALQYHAVQTFQVTREQGTLAHYLLALVAAEAVLMVAGLQELTAKSLRHWVFVVLVICFGALELFSLHFYAIPYYTGLTSHVATGGVPALKVHDFLNGGVQTMSARLAVNKPAFLTVDLISTLWIVFLLATLGIVVFSFYICRLSQERSNEARFDRSVAAIGAARS
jgi:hypothetical protein